MFAFEDYQVKDTDFDHIINILKFHSYVSFELSLTDSGEEYLKSFSDDPFMISILQFESYYLDEPATLNSCFSNQDFFAVSCGLCRDKTCLNKGSNILELLPFSLRKRKNPYKSVSF